MRRSTRRAGSVAAKTVVPVIVGAAVAFSSALPVDKRDDELTDEESLDREERQELY